MMERNILNPGSPVITLTCGARRSDGQTRIRVQGSVPKRSALKEADFVCAPDGFIFKNRFARDLGNTIPKDLTTILYLERCLRFYREENRS